MVSQYSVVAATSKVVCMVVKREDKSLLAESLRTQIDFKIMDMQFVDRDRPDLDNESA